MSPVGKGKRSTSGRATAFWTRFSAYVEEAQEGELRLPLVLLLAAVIPEVSPKQYDSIEERLAKVLEKGGKCRT